MPSFLGRIPNSAERRFGAHTLLAKLGWGGMADVYLARPDEAPRDLVVIKRLKPDLAGDPEHRAMFDAEADLASRFDHPNIVRSLGAGVADDTPYLVLEYLEGCSLDRAIDEKRGVFDADDVLAIACGILRGLEHAHGARDERGAELGVIHRDVSPHNVFLTLDGKVKLVDFGIAKSKLVAQQTATGVVKGKLAYMAPEQALANEVDHRADLFAVGVVVSELLSGERYWGARSDVQILKAMTFGELPAMPETLPSEIATVLRKALTVTSAERWSTARAFADALEALLPVEKRRAPDPRLGEKVAALVGSAPDTVRDIVRAEREADVVLRSTDGQAVPNPPRADAARELLADAPSASARPRRGPLWIAGGVVVVGAVALVGRVMAGSTGDTARVDPSRVVAASAAVSASASDLDRAPAASATSSSAPALPNVPQVTVRIVASPSNARIVLDGVELATNPFVAKFPKDGTPHKLAVSAPGYADDAELVVFDADVAIERRLTRGNGLARPPSSAGRPPTPASSSTGGAPRVDPRDPWGH